MKTLICPYCGGDVSPSDRECACCGCPMTTILKELGLPAVETSSVPVPQISARVPGSAEVPALSPVFIYRQMMGEMVGSAGAAAMLTNYMTIRDEADRLQKEVDTYQGRQIRLQGMDAEIEDVRRKLAEVQEEYDRIGGFFAGMKKTRKKAEMEEAAFRLRALLRDRDEYSGKYLSADKDDLRRRLKHFRREEADLLRDLEKAGGPGLVNARNAILSDGRLLAEALTDPETFALLDRDMFFRRGLDAAGPAVRYLAGVPEALARLQVRGLPEALLEQVEGSCKTSVLGSYGWTQESLRKQVLDYYKEVPLLRDYHIETDVAPSFFGVREENGPHFPVDILFVKLGQPVLAVHIASIKTARQGMTYVRKGCRERHITYMNFLTDYPNMRHYVVRRTLEALGEI